MSVNSIHQRDTIPIFQLMDQYGTMLLWLPTEDDPPLFQKRRKRRTGIGVPSGDSTVYRDENDREKGDKLRRRKLNRLQYRNELLLVIGIILCGLVFAGMASRRLAHNKSAFRRTNYSGLQQPSQSVNSAISHGELPPNSIYRLDMPDVHGKKVSLSQFAGMVTLVVNTACL